MELGSSRIRIIGLLMMAIWPMAVTGQINESDSLRLKADLSLTGLWQGGNVETVIFRAKSGLAFKPWKKWVFKTQNSYVYQEFDRDKADADFLSLNFLYFNPEQRWYPQVLAIYSSNFRREINSRYLLGGGVTYQAVRKKKNWLKLSLSVEYEETDFKQALFNRSQFNGQTSIDTFRATFWTSGKFYLFDQKLILNHELYLQPSLEVSENFRWRADLGLELPVWKFLNFKVNYLHAFESVVIQDQKQQDQFLTFGFVLKSYSSVPDK